MLQGPGENAGVIDVGDGLAVAFKVESHNHPSAVEPYQGAATGVGGILRDIFAMGARPIALGDSLRLGPLDEERPRELFRGIVRGIGGYGNCVGVPERRRRDGLRRRLPAQPARQRALHRPAAGRPSSCARARRAPATWSCSSAPPPAATASAARASWPRRTWTRSDEDKRPSVQVGDPFTGKKLIECTLELAARGLVVSVQDLGAAGLASSTSEMAASGGVGIELELDRVPLREQGMQPFEIMISESQERMAAIVAARAPGRGRGRVRALAAARARSIGPVTDDGRLRCRYDGELVGDMPAEALADAPRYPLHAERPEGLAERALSADEVPPVTDPAALLLALLAAPNICAKTWVYEQYDQVVGSGTVAPPRRRRRRGAPDAVRARHRGRAGRRRRARRARPAPRRRRGRRAVGAQRRLQRRRSPRRVTNCLNFGNPERPGTAYALREAITGMAEACEVLGTPVVSGNVSLYNESGGRPIHPTPVVGCVGVLERADAAVPAAPADASGRAVRARHRCAGLRRLGVAGAEWPVRAPAASPRSTCPRCAGSATCSASSRATACSTSAHDVSDGGLAVALAEVALASRQRAAGRDRAGRRRRGDALRRVLRARRRELRARQRGAPGQGLRRCRGATRENRRPGRVAASRCAAESSRSTSRWTMRARPTRSTLPRAMAAG